MAYIFKQKVLFKHCDPAGIVFYPRYFEMMNDAVEMFFSDVICLPFEILHETGGVPTAEIKTRFHAPSRHGDQLEIAIHVTRIGKSSLEIEMLASCDQQSRFTTNITLVHINSKGVPEKWSDNERKKFEREIKKGALAS